MSDGTYHMGANGGIVWSRTGGPVGPIVVDCVENLFVPPRYIVMHPVDWAWSSGNQTWYLCTDSGNFYTSTRTYAFNFQLNHCTPRCPGHWHGTVNWGYVWYQGAWRGGSVWSGAHVIGTAGTANVMTMAGTMPPAGAMPRGSAPKLPSQPPQAPAQRATSRSVKDGVETVTVVR